MRDPYDVLGVSRSASAADIKSAFRKQAKKLHPDANKHDPKAATRFAELNTAYEILGEEKKRKAYDRGEIDAEGKPRFQGFEGFGAGRGGFGEGGFEAFNWGSEGFRRSGGRGASPGGFEDLLKEAFAGVRTGARGRSARGSSAFEADDLFGADTGGGLDIGAALTITLAEAAKGAKKRVMLPTGKEVDVKIPPGLADGQQIRLKAQGQRARNGRTGDLLIAVTIAPHPLFKRDGNDLRLELPITLYEAVLGAKVRVPTLDGAVDLAIPPGTNSGRTFRLRGKGFPAKEGAGDLYVSVRIMLPEGSDVELDALMRKWRDSKIYDPGRGVE
ncbi:MAG: DnaJ C-terminal domain-containing protein [Xanthobacteraceae bacterium]